MLAVPGLGDSSSGHWQTLWSESHPAFRRLVQRDWNEPKLDAWAATVARAIDDCVTPPIVVAHSFGCLAAVRAGHLLERPIASALLVAPADPEHFGASAKLPARPLRYPSILVASSNDPCLKVLKAGALATRWNSRLVALRDAGHIDVESGHGDWPAGLDLLDELQREAIESARPRRVEERV